MKQTISATVNGSSRTSEVEPRMLLVHWIREVLGLRGAHVGCDTTSCGVCTVLVDGLPVKSCTMFAVQVDGRAVTTVEGMATNGQLHPVQAAFHEEHGLQCGFCTPGMMLVGAALLEENPDPTEEEVRWAISGNLCRCTGYQNIVRAVQYAAGQLRGGAADAGLPMDRRGERPQPSAGAPQDPETVGEWGGELAGETDDTAR